jgi:DNA-binding MarR family transcriptional regulator
MPAQPAPLDKETRIALNRVKSALETFLALDRDMPMGEALAFLHIALGETADTALSIKELQDRATFPMSTASRYVHSLAEMDRHGRQGKEMITHPRDPLDDRRKVLRITAKGRRIANQLRTALGE